MTAPEPQSQTPLHIGILECGIAAEHLRRDHGSFADWFERYLAGPLAPVTFSRYAAYLGHIPQSPGECDCYIVTGSSASANGAEAWIEILSAFLRSAVEHRRILGVCFGHQLLHKIHGGTVGSVEEGWGIGVHEYAVHGGEDCILNGLERLALLTSHNEQVTRPAPEARIMASSAFCEVGVSMIGNNVLTLQAHPEATREFCGALYRWRRDIIGANQVDAAIASLDLTTSETAFADIVDRFFRGAIR